MKDKGDLSTTILAATCVAAMLAATGVLGAATFFHASMKWAFKPKAGSLTEEAAKSARLFFPKSFFNY